MFANGYVQWRRRSAAIVIAATMVATGCKGKSDNARAELAPADSAVEISPANVAVLVHEEIRSGPIVSGLLSPRREASIRAEIGGSILQTLAEKGQPVGRGALLARIDDSSVRDALLSARSGVTSAASAAELARRNVERAEKLAAAGAISDRDLEQARVSASSAQSQLADARARLAVAQKQVNATQVRAPFAGVITDRPVNAGDVVTPGTALYSMMDPASGMKFEAAVAAEQMAELRVGAPVQFRVHGYVGRVFTGTIERINPAADPTTGQIALYVAIPDARGLVAGLYAEGRVGSRAKMTLTAPANAITMSGDTTFVMRVQQSRVQRVPMRIGVRDEEGERVEVIGAVAAGDTVLIGAAASISPGSLIRIQPISDNPAARR